MNTSVEIGNNPPVLEAVFQNLLYSFLEFRKDQLTTGAFLLFWW